MSASPYGDPAFYHTAPHLFNSQPIFSPYPPYPVAPLSLPAPSVPSAPPDVQPVPAEMAPPPASVAAIASSFLEYKDLATPRYYNFPSGMSSDPADAGFWSFDDDVSPGPSAILAIDFVLADSNASRIVITLTLWAGKRAICAKALIDSGLEGDFEDSTFATINALSFLKRKHPITCASFDCLTAAAGQITHFWSGSMTMIGTTSQLFHSYINLNPTRSDGFDMILGASWLCHHEGWVGGSGPSLCLYKPILVSGDSLGEDPTVVSTSSGIFSSTTCDVPPQSSILPQFSRFADVFDPQGPSSLPLH